MLDKDRLARCWLVIKDYKTLDFKCFYRFQAWAYRKALKHEYKPL